MHCIRESRLLNHPSTPLYPLLSPLCSISCVPNQQFYGGRLIDGCTREQRASLLPGLPSLALLDVRGQEQYSGGG